MGWKAWVCRRNLWFGCCRHNDDVGLSGLGVFGCAPAFHIETRRAARLDKTVGRHHTDMKRERLGLSGPLSFAGSLAGAAAASGPAYTLTVGARAQAEAEDVVLAKKKKARPTGLHRFNSPFFRGTVRETVDVVGHVVPSTMSACGRNRDHQHDDGCHDGDNVDQHRGRHAQTSTRPDPSPRTNEANPGLACRERSSLFPPGRDGSTAADLNLREQIPEFGEGLFHPSEQPVQFIPLDLNTADVAAQLLVNL